ncbi:MAG: HAMP domain-containing histidine kinase [Actinomycetota bacterium]|nr:HAMP domain-containing histidine kinase [Actinomycetota bacterium]
MSLRARVLAGVALIAVVLGIVMVIITATTRASLLRQVDAQLRGAVGPVRGADPGRGHPPPGGPGQPRQNRHLTSLYVGHVRGGEVQTVVTPDLGGNDIPLPAITARQATQAARDRETITVGSVGSDLEYRLLAYVDERAREVVVLALPIDSVDAAVDNLITVEAVGAVVIAVTLGLVAWWVIHLGVRPVKRMTSVATAIADGDLSQRVPDANPHTEAGELGTALNRMLGQIEAAFDERSRAEERLRQFVADASHELRTPVATIRGYAELYRNGGLHEPAALDDAIGRTEQEAVRMGSLVDDLLHLTRLDDGRPLESQPVDLAAVAVDAAGDARAVDPGRPVEAVTDGPVMVTGDEFRLRQVVANVVGNALVHTPPGTPIEIQTRREDGAAVIDVTDHGPGMSNEVAAHAFERFYRADPARSRHRGGSGLGLSIVEATVRAHSGTTSLDTAPGEGTTVRITLPIRPPASPPDGGVRRPQTLAASGPRWSGGDAGAVDLGRTEAGEEGADVAHGLPE